MFINHLCYRIAKQYNVLIKRFNLPLQFDTVYQINGNRHMLATQGIEERVLQQLAFIAHAISPYCLKLSRLGYLLTQAARELGSCCSKDEMGVKHNTTSPSIRPAWHIWQQSVTQLLDELPVQCHFMLSVSVFEAVFKFQSRFVSFLEFTHITVSSSYLIILDECQI